MKRPAMKPEHRQEVQRLAEEVMDIALQAAARRLVQTLQEVHDSNITPLRQGLRNCQTLTPSLMDGEAAIARLKEINQHVYAVLEKH
jgi:hypothetical protein